MKKTSEEVAFANRWKQQTPEYLCNPQFINSAPSIQAGPYFKKIGLSHTFEDFADYHMSSLEKNHVWKPHINAAKCLDIVDQDALMSGNKGGGGLKLSSSLGSNKIAWLKKTTYLTNNLYDNVHKFTGDEGIVSGYKEKAERQIGENEGPFTDNSIEKSFRLIVTKTKSSLEAQKDNKHRGVVEWILPVLPDETLWENELSLLRFEKDPKREGLHGPANFTEEQISNSIVTNIRAAPVTDRHGKDAQKYAVSLVVPSDADPTLYNWVRDFRMEILARNENDSFLFTVDNESTVDASVSYVPLRSKLELKRLPKEECNEHKASVKRRNISSGEENSAKRLKNEISSLVLEQKVSEEKKMPIITT